MTYSIGELAERSGVTVRTLHHYDALGLLVPDRDHTGSRRYSHDDVDRLAEILTYRALGIELGRIGDILDGGGDPTQVLQRRHTAVRAHIDRLERVLAEIEHRLEETTMEPTELKAIFGDFDPDEHAAEAKERWGDTDAYRESTRRASAYGERDWIAIRTEGDAIGNRFGVLVDTGASPESQEAMDLAEEHRRHISRWFYDCSYEIHVGLGDMYVADPRFAKYWDEGFGDGVAAFVRDAIAANAIRNV